jgi:hypothetical protein
MRGERLSGLSPVMEEIQETGERLESIPGDLIKKIIKKIGIV